MGGEIPCEIVEFQLIVNLSQIIEKLPLKLPVNEGLAQIHKILSM